MFKRKAAIAMDLLAGRCCDSCRFYFWENPMDSINKQIPQWELKFMLPKKEYFEELKRVKFLKYCFKERKEEKKFGTCKEWKEKT